jgi:hypothetical protein
MSIDVPKLRESLETSIEISRRYEIDYRNRGDLEKMEYYKGYKEAMQTVKTALNYKLVYLPRNYMEIGTIYKGAKRT